MKNNSSSCHHIGINTIDFKKRCNKFTISKNQEVLWISDGNISFDFIANQKASNAQSFPLKTGSTQQYL